MVGGLAEGVVPFTTEYTEYTETGREKASGSRWPTSSTSCGSFYEMIATAGRRGRMV